MAPGPDAVIFDVDGVLVDTEGSYIEGVARAVQWILVHEAGLRDDGAAVDRELRITLHCPGGGSPRAGCLTWILPRVILRPMTKRTAISLPDDLYRQIERARKRTRKDRSTWLREAAGEYLKKRTKKEEVEAYFAGYERAPLTEDELSLLRWNEEHFGETLAETTAPRGRRQRGSRR